MLKGKPKIMLQYSLSLAYTYCPLRDYASRRHHRNVRIDFDLYDGRAVGRGETCGQERRCSWMKS